MDPAQESFPYKPHSNNAIFFFGFVLFCFGKLMMAIDGIPSQTIATHIIQNPIPSKTKRGSKDGSELHDVGGSWENEKGNERKNIREFLEACIDSFLYFVTSSL